MSFHHCQNFRLQVSVIALLSCLVFSPLSDANEPETVFDAVIKQLKHNESLMGGSENGSKTEHEDGFMESTLDSDLADAIVEQLRKKITSTDESEGRSANSKAIATHLAEVVKEAVEEEFAEKRPEQIARNKKKKAENKKPQEFSQAETRTVKPALNALQDKGRNKRVNSDAGWVYLGHFAGKGWLRKTLNIKRSLPKVGRSYTVMQSLNLRSDPPTKTGTAQLIKSLKKDDHVKILKVRPSGTEGHYWAQVEL